MKDKKEILRKTAVLCWGFVLAALIGWLYEEAADYIMMHEFTDRGILWLPVCPIYGFGAWGMYLAVRKIKNPLLIVSACAVISGVFEYVCSYILEKFFDLELWTYECWPLPINDRISIVVCVLFGLFELLFVKAIIPGVKKAGEKVSLSVFAGGAFCIVAALVVDAVISIGKMLG